MMYADELAWHLREYHADSYLKIPIETLKSYQLILQNYRPNLNSDLATMAIYRCQDCIRIALKKLDTDLHRDAALIANQLDR